MTMIIKDNTLKFSFNLKDYPLEALCGAAYVFLDRAYIFLDSKTKGIIEVSLKGKKQLVKEQLEKIKGEFLNELFNYTIRIKMTKSNQKIREFIIGQALVSAVGNNNIIQKNEMEYEDDPLGILMPWEDKYQKKNKK